MPHHPTVAPVVIALSMSLAAVAGCVQLQLPLAEATGRPGVKEPARTGSLTVAVRLAPGRQAQFLAAEVERVVVEVRAGNLSQSATLERSELVSGSGSARFLGLLPNTWTVTAIAQASDSSEIGESLPLEVKVEASQAAQASISLVLRPDVTPGEPLPEPTDAPGSADSGASTQAMSLNLNIPDSEQVTFPLAGVVSTLAGSSAGWQDGKGSAAKFNNPQDIAVDASGSLYVADTGNHMIRKISPSGVVTTLAGNGTPGWSDGKGTSATLYEPSRLTVDDAGNVYVAGLRGYLTCRKITPDGVVTSIGIPGDDYPLNILAGKDGKLYFSGELKIFTLDSVISGAGQASDFAFDSKGTLYFAEKPGSIFGNRVPDRIGMMAADGSYRAASVRTGVYSMAFDAADRLFFSSPAGVGMVTPAGGIAMLPDFPYRGNIAIDRAGRIYMADAANHCIRLIR